MGFDKAKFEEAKLQPRIANELVPDLKEFFEKDEKPLWKVRGLTGEEMAHVNEAVKLNRDLVALIQGLISADTEAKIKAIKESIGLSDEVPDDLARRISLLQHGSIEPQCSQPMSVRVARTFPVVFFQLTNKILELTGLGHTLGEQSASGQTTG